MFYFGNNNRRKKSVRKKVSGFRTLEKNTILEFRFGKNGGYRQYPKSGTAHNCNIHYIIVTYSMTKYARHLLTTVNRDNF